MFDKMIFNAKVDFIQNAEELARRQRLIKCTEGTNVYYQSSALSNIEGVFLKIVGNNVQIKCSLHKLYYRALYGVLDNTQMFTISNARYITKILFDDLGISTERVKITYYEIGLSMRVKHDPIEYISIIKSVGSFNEKEFFNDANYQKNRQKTTEKSKTIRKIFKIYDKGFEAREKKRKVTDNILRIETIYRRQNIGLNDFFSQENIRRIIGAFYRDWSALEFERVLKADKGIKESQILKARNLLLFGRDEYLKRSLSDRNKGIISEKNYRTIREFIRDWDQIKGHFKMIPDERETEYKELLINTFGISKT